MTAIRIFTDEDIYGAVAPALRHSGIDAVSTPESGRRGESDESQLAWAVSEGRAMVSFNVAHYAALHTAWRRARRDHTGIILSSQRPLGDLLRRLLRLTKKLDTETIRNRLQFLNDW